MMLMLFCLLGGFAGLAIRYYLQHFIVRIQQQVYFNYVEIFPDSATKEIPSISSLKPIKCGHFLLYFISWAALFLASYLYFSSELTALLVAGATALLFIIAKLDWHYQLIPIEICHLLTALSFALAYFNYSTVSLQQAVQSYAYGFLFFWILFHIAAYCYKLEAFGRGDYWLIAALASFHPWQDLPLMIFISSLSAILFVVFRREKIQFIPFAPFLILGHIFSLVLNVLA